MKNKYEKQNVATNIFWKFIERFFSLGISLLTNILLARLLLPEDFGMLAVINVFVAIMQIFVTSGINNSLVQKRNSDQLDFSSVFWFNLGISFIFYFLLYIFAPTIAGIYDNKKLISILRVISLQIPIAAIFSIQGAYISKNMLFRYYFLSTLLGKISSGLLGIILAYAGFGVWALVVQSVSLLLFESILLWFKLDWRPSFDFSWARVKKLYPFAFGLMVRSFIENIGNNFRVLLIGNFYTASQLAYYDKGNLFPNTIVTNISTSTSSVMFPVLSNEQENYKQVLNISRRWIKLFFYILFPILVGLAIVSKPFILVLLTEKWLPAVPYLRIASVMYISWTIEVPIRETIKSLGYSNLLLKIEVLKTLLTIFLLLITIRISVLAVALATIINSVFNVILSLIYANKLFGYKFKYLVKDLLSTILLTLIMSIILVFIGLLISFQSPLQELIIKIIVGAGFYIIGSTISRNESFHYLLSLTVKK